MQLVDLKEGEDVHAGFTNQVDGNAYWPMNSGTGFGALYHVRHPDGGTGNFKAESLSEWQSTTVHDQSSFTVDVDEAHVVNPNDAESGWQLASGSQMIGKAVSLPDKWDPVLKDFDGNPRPAEGADIGADQVSSKFLAEQEISLHEGWNLISSYVQPYDSSMSEVFAGLLTRVEVVRNEAGERFVPEEDENTLSAWRSREAYRVYMKEPGTLQLKGTRLSPDTTSISLQEGWNLLPYFRDYSMPVEDALASLSSALVMVKDGTGQVYLPSFSINALGSLQPGRGYKVYLLHPDTLTYPANATSTVW